MAQKHNAEYAEQPMTRYGKMQGPNGRYRRLRNPNFPAAKWAAKNPLLQRGEIGIELDTHKAKVGDGTTYWNDLPYSFTSEIEWGSIVGDIADQTDLDNALSGKVDKTSVANQVYGTDGDGNQTTYNASDFDAVVDVKVNDVSVVTNKVANINLATVATSGQYSDLTGTPGVMTGASAGDAGTSGLVPAPAAGDQGKFLQGDGTWANPTAATAWGNITGTLSDQTDLQSALNAKQDTLTAGTNITITSNTISATDTTYTGSDGITLTGTNFTNSGVRSVASGTTNGTISVNTGGTTADVAVTGLGSAAYTASSAYATSAQGGKADTAVQPGDLATVATTGDYDDLLNKPTIPTVNDATLTIQKNGTTVNTFTANASSNVTANITVPTKISDLTNDSNFVNTDLSNLTSTGANISNWSSNVSNCITEIPQDISATITNGHLIVNAGSKVYFPNGSGTFDVFTLPSDFDSGDVSGITADYLFFINQTKTGIAGTAVTSAYSGTTAPATPSTGTVWYDTTNNNSVKRWSGSAWVGGFSLPFILVGSGATVKNIFNGQGYMYSTRWVLPSTKGLISDGFNSDGTAKNIQMTVNNVQVYTYPNNVTVSDIDIWLTSTGDDGGTNANIKYISEVNKVLYTVDGSQRQYCSAGTISIVSGVITKFTPKQAFRVVDYSDTEFIAHQAMPSVRYVDLTLGTSGATYTAPADGWFVIIKTSGVTNGALNIYNNTTELGYTITAPTTTNVMRLSVPVSKGDVIQLNYSMTGTTNYFRFVYANGAK